MRNPLRYRLWWTTRQKILTSVVVGALLVTAGWYGVDRLTTPEDRSCAAGVARPEGSDECIGVSGTGYDFGRSQLTAVAAAIGRENKSLKADSYVTVALLLPLTSTESSMRTKVLHELQGAYAAQYAANHDANGKVPHIRVVLANTGTNSVRWQPVVDRLKKMTDAPDRLRAVSGVAISSTHTKEAVKALTGAGIPVVGSTITADDIANGPGPDDNPFPGLARVSPTNNDEARALTSIGGVRADKALLVQDTRKGDHYTDTLKSAFNTLLEGSRYEPQLFTSREDPNDEGFTANTFEQITHLICDTDAETVYFAGRHVQLRQFINALGARGCQNRAFLVLTGDEGSYLGSDKKLDRDALRRKVTVRYAALAHPDTWPATAAATKKEKGGELTGGSEKDYQAFTDLLARLEKKPAGPIGPTAKDDLTDGQVIIAHDAMTLAVAAVRRATDGKQLPALEEVGTQWPLTKGSQQRVNGASGWICLDNHGNPHNKAVPLVELAADPPHQRFAALAWPEGKPPESTCLTPSS
ncbi:ABC transporter substrate-binding protein [Streptomyces sp. NPDC102402]|uniref:ABC transporter substrate-binding protein n=1 Tax=Streptomyces sp. NPDC102402 TaxID=3366169 RepID=UPI0037FE8CAA